MYVETLLTWTSKVSPNQEANECLLESHKNSYSDALIGAEAQIVFQCGDKGEAGAWEWQGDNYSNRRKAFLLVQGAWSRQFQTVFLIFSPVVMGLVANLLPL